VLVSSAARAQETWGAAKPAFPHAACDVRPELYNADQRDLLRIARKVDGESVMIVAHNPGLHALADALVDRSGNATLQGKLRDGFPTAAIAVFDLEGDAVTARSVLFPKDHGGGSGDD